MIRRIRYISYLLVLNTLLLSSDIVLFDLDVIENNQLILSSENTSILDTLSFRSIIFNQGHHLPYGTFLFNDSREIQKPDTVSHLSQFIHKKGDYRYRDLVVSLAKINRDNVSYQLIAQNKSFTPLSIYNVSGKGFLQNFLFDFKKETHDIYLSGAIAYHKENPYLPISYNFNSSNQGVFNTRESESVLWGFILKKDIGGNISINIRNSGQKSSMLNNYNIKHPSLSEIEGSFNNNNFTVWSIANSSYKISSNAYLKINLSSKISSSLYENYDSDLTLDSLRYRSNTYRSLSGLELQRAFIGLDVTSSTFTSGFISESSIAAKPYISAKIFDHRDVVISINHKNKSVLSQMPYSSMIQDEDFIPPMLSIQATEASVSRVKGKYNLKASASYISTDNYYTSDTFFSDYIYSNLYISYLGRRLSLSISYKSYDGVEPSNSSEYLPILNKHLSYSAIYEIPIKDREYSIVFRANGRLSKLKNGAFNLNTLPMIRANDIIGEDRVHYLDLSGSLEFNNFTISYNNITNAGDQFGLVDPLSDVGGAFSLPTYSILDRELSIFHYLKVSWVFLD